MSLFDSVNDFFRSFGENVSGLFDGNHLTSIFENFDENKFNAFDVDLFKKLCESSDENIFISPLSVSLALSMLLLGSSGATKQQLEKALGVEVDKHLTSQIKSMNNILRSNSSSLQIKLANSVFPSKTFKMINKYKSEVVNAFKCQIQTLDYEKNAPKCIKTINDWVASCTNGKIKDLLSDLKSDTACVLVSCIYFKCDWYDKFKKRNTCNGYFNCTEKKRSLVKMMHQRNHYLYRSVDESGFRCLKIPYKKPNFRMLIILPNKSFGLDEVINKLDDKAIESLKVDSNFRKEDVALKMPKFKIEYQTNLNKNLRSLGVKDVFEKWEADFGAMSRDARQPDRNLYVDEVIHKAFVETSEEGTEAAAATVVRGGLVRTCARKFSPRPIYFTVDHPFLFLILYKNLTLFMGKVTSG